MRRLFAAALNAMLRGMGQVMLQNSSYAGLFFLAGIFYNSRLFGIAVLVGTGVSTGCAALLGAEPRLIREGLYGFNGALTAIALAYFLRPSGITWAYLVFAAAVSAVVMAALLHWLEAWRLAPLTAPFVLTALGFLLAGARFGRLPLTHILPTAGLPQAATVQGVVTAATLGGGLLRGLAQVFFQGSAITGVLFAIGLLLSSRRALAVALLGSLLGAVTAWGLGAAEPAIRSGAWGFNCVLTALALDAILPVRNWAALGFTALGTIAAAVVYAAVSAALQPLGMPALTLPFVLAAWLFLLGARPFSRRRAAPSVASREIAG